MANPDRILAIRHFVLTYRWPLVIVIGLANISFEWVEHTQANSLAARFSWEVFLFGLFYPLLAGWTLTLLWRWDKTLIELAHFQYLEKRFTQKLGQVPDWQALQTLLPELLCDVAPFKAIIIFIHDQNHDHFETAVEWHHPHEKPLNIPAFLTIDSPSTPIPSELHPIDRKIYPELPPINQYAGYCLPLGVANVTTALVMLFIRPPDKLKAEQIRVLNDTTSTLALTINNFHPLAAQPVWHAATLAERQRMARQLHDTIAQHLNLLRMKLQGLKGEKVLAEVTAVREELSHMNEIADLAYKQIRSVLQTLQTPTDLVASIKEQTISIGEMADVEVDFKQTGKAVPLAPYISHDVLSIMRELLLNVGKHAQAQQISVTLQWTPEILELVVADDGIGFDINSIPAEGHYGLLIIQERAKEINGRLQIESAPGQGTIVHLHLPIFQKP
ncbi:MAG: hypothetical protein KC449_02025 [Anaerolineales bacterium]|nr:hypothetical protein [Anaerolineales bacterium]